VKQVGEYLPAAGTLPTGDAKSLQSAGSVTVTSSSPITGNSSSAPSQPAKAGTAQAAPVRPPPSAARASKKDTKAVSAELLAAKNAEKSSNYVQAKKHCEAALKMDPGQPQAVLLLGRLEIAGGHFKAAAKLFKDRYPAVLKTKPHCVEAFTLLATVAEKAGDWDEAATELERGLRAATPGGFEDQFSRQNLMGKLAKARWHGGDRDIAADLAQKVLDEAQTQLEASEVACVLLMDKGDSATAMAVMLRTLIAHRSSPSSVCAQLVCGVMKRCSVEELMHVLQPKKDGPDNNASSVAEVVGYIGLIMKEQSEVIEGCKLYREASLLAPFNASLCLNLMHCYVLRRDYVGALAFGDRFMTLIAGQKGTAPSIAAQAIHDALRGKGSVEQTLKAGKPPLFAPEMFAGIKDFYDVVGIGFVIVKILFILAPYVSATEEEANDPQELPWRKKFLEMNLDKDPVGKTVSKMGDISCATGFCEAHKKTLRQLCIILHATRSGNDLHLTPVRNEQAYFGCVYDLMGLVEEKQKIMEVEEEEASYPSGEPIYVIGDSHVLSPAWQSVTLPSGKTGSKQRRTFAPCVVTGAKLWHLRKSSDFYTRFSFWDQVTRVPAGADIVFVLGEIDCREGVITAVQKGKYPSVEAALTSTVTLYLELVKEVRKRMPRIGRIFLHPVPEILTETRFLTLAFNRTLASPEAAATLAEVGAKFLNMGCMLEGGDPAADMSPTDLGNLSLLPDLTLDGTHWSSRYVASHLEPALINAW